MMREKVIQEARSWLGTPYHHEGRVKGVGVDCAMLLVAVYHACGLIPDIDPRPYSFDWMLNRDEEKFLGWVKEYGSETDDPQPGDVLVWRFGRTFSHGSILVDQVGAIVHAYRPAGYVTLGSMFESDLASRRMKAYCVRGIE